MWLYGGEASPLGLGRGWCSTRAGVGSLGPRGPLPPLYLHQGFRAFFTESRCNAVLNSANPGLLVHVGICLEEAAPARKTKWTASRHRAGILGQARPLHLARGPDGCSAAAIHLGQLSRKQGKAEKVPQPTDKAVKGMWDSTPPTKCFAQDGDEHFQNKRWVCSTFPNLGDFRAALEAHQSQSSSTLQRGTNQTTIQMGALNSLGG